MVATSLFLCRFMVQAVEVFVEIDRESVPRYTCHSTDSQSSLRSLVSSRELVNQKLPRIRDAAELMQDGSGKQLHRLGLHKPGYEDGS
jgi:hypothetical protein